MHSVCDAAHGCCFLKFVGRPRMERAVGVIAHGSAGTPRSSGVTA